MDIKCPHCGCSEVVRYGKHKGRQRYKCQCEECGRFFLGEEVEEQDEEKETQLKVKTVQLWLEGISESYISELLRVKKSTIRSWVDKYCRNSGLGGIRLKREPDNHDLHRVDRHITVYANEPYSRRLRSGVFLDGDDTIEIWGVRASSDKKKKG
ncbi:MAG: hypothetical protein ABEH38_09695 [Flavobacteriales bacterium]